MGMVRYDGLTELQNRPVNTLEGSMSVQAKYCGSDRRWYMYIHMRSSSGASINSRQVSVNLLYIVLGRNVNSNAVKMLL